jgi:hypothetical protein
VQFGSADDLVDCRCEQFPPSDGKRSKASLHTIYYLSGGGLRMLDLIRRLVTGFAHDGWVPLVMLGALVFWMAHSA